MGWVTAALGIPPRGEPPPPPEERAAGTGLSLVTQADVIMGATVPADVRTLPAVTGARRLIASTIDQLKVRTTRGGVDYPAEWLRSPRKFGGNLDAGDLVQHCVDSMVLHGRAYLECTRLSEDSWRVDAVDPNYVQVLNDTRGVVSRTFTLAGEKIREVPWELGTASGRYLLHIPYVVTVDHPEGTTPLTESAHVLRGLLATEQHVAEKFAGGNTWTGGILTSTQQISHAQAVAAGDEFMARRQQNKIPVLGMGVEYRNETPSARDLQMVEARSFNQSVVWAMLGIPQAYMGSSLMGGQSSLSYANAQDNRRQFAENCLRAFTTQIEDALSRLLPHGRNQDEDVIARFDYSEWEGRADGDAAGAVGTVPAG